MNKLEKYLVQTEKQEVKTWIQTVLNAKFKNEHFIENQGEIEHILDFLNSSSAPPRLSKMSYEQAKIETDKWTKTQIKKGHNIIETDEDIEVILRSRKTGFKLVKLIGENAFKREGHLMRHCVSSYFNKDTEIYSLRDEKNEPHCTIEVQKKNNTITQIKGKGNGSIHPNYIKYVIKILKYFKMSVNSNDMNNLGYFSPSKDLLLLLETKFRGVKFINFGGNKYIYKNSKIEAL